MYKYKFTCNSLVSPYRHFIGLTQSKKTSVMSTPKGPGTHIWHINWLIYPLGIDILWPTVALTYAMHQGKNFVPH